MAAGRSGRPLAAGRAGRFRWTDRSAGDVSISSAVPARTFITDPGTKVAMFAVAGGKGGCGKTTTTLGLGRAAARAGLEALLVDADAAMPNLHTAAGVDREPTLGDGAPSTVAQAHPENPAVGIVPAPGATAASTTSLERCRDAADVVLLDCPAGAGRDAAVPLRVADATVLVTTTEPTSLRAAALTAAVSRTIGTPVAGVIVSRAAEVPGGVAELLETRVLGCVPYADSGTGKSAVTTAYDRIIGGLAGRRA